MLKNGGGHNIMSDWDIIFTTVIDMNSWLSSNNVTSS